jgi:hypothetical protein
MSVACSVPRRHRIISLVAENTENARVPDTNKRRWIIKIEYERRHRRITFIY